MSDFLGGYGPRTGSGAVWAPQALNAGAVAYPTNPWDITPGGNARPLRSNRSLPRPAQTYVPDPNTNTFAGVKAGDFGGGPGGIRSGDFGGPSDSPYNRALANVSGGQVNRGGYARGGGNTGGGGGAAGGVNNLVQQYEQALNRANQANEARYRDVLGGYQSRYERGLGMLDGMGQQEAKDINELYDAQQAAQRQSLIGRGLGNSTVLDTMLAGVDRERAADLGRLNERMRQQTLATDAGLSGDTLQFMERKTEVGPDMAMLAQLAQGMGQAGYGAGGAGFGGGGYDTGGGGYSNPMAMLGGGYAPRMFSTDRGDARKAAARANYSARNANKTDWPGQGGPVSSDYATSWLPTGYMSPAQQAAADAERVANAMRESGAGNPAANPYLWFDPRTMSYADTIGGMF